MKSQMCQSHSCFNAGERCSAAGLFLPHVPLFQRQFVQERQRTESLMRAARAKWQICLLVSAQSSCELTCYVSLHHKCANIRSLSAVVLPGLKTFQQLMYKIIINKPFITFRVTVTQIQLCRVSAFFIYINVFLL